MSLFPAYKSVSDQTENTPTDDVGNNSLDNKIVGTSHKSENKSWITNESYKLKPIYSKPPTVQSNSNTILDGTTKSNNALHKSPDYAEKRSRSDTSSISSDHDKSLSNNDFKKIHRDESETKRSDFGDHTSSSISRSRKKHRHQYSKSRSRSSSSSEPQKYQSKKKKRKHKQHKKKQKIDYDSSKFKIPKFTPYKTFLEDFNIKDEDAFRFGEDRCGDKNLSSSNALPSRQTAKYYQKWKRDYYVLGSVMNWKYQSKGRNKGQNMRFYHKDYTKKFSNTTPDSILNLTSHLDSNQNPNLLSHHKGYIEFAKDKRDIAELEDDKDLLKRQNYVKEEFPDTSITIELNEIYSKTKEFNLLLRENPSDVQLWLDYVAFQDAALGTSEFSSKNSKEPDENVKPDKKAEKARNVLLRNKAVTEKKLSILKSASEKNPGSILLAVERLKISKELYDNETLDRQWKELIFMFPGNLEVWKHYLAFVSSHFTTFSVNKITRSYKNFFLKLKQMHERGTMNLFHPTSENVKQASSMEIENEIVNLILRLANLWTRAGYREKAIALFQALVELNLFSPNFPGSYSLEDRLATFEPFWESGLPRFGEMGAVGWAVISKNKNGIANFNDSDMDESYRNPNNDDVEDDLIQEFRSNKEDKSNVEKDESGEDDNEYNQNCGEVGLWLRLELERERRQWFPWRSREEEAEDPERSVCFEDIQGYLFQFPPPSTTTNSRAMFYLILGFIRHFGVNIRDENLGIFGVLSTQTFRNKLGFDFQENVNVDDRPLCNGVLQSVSPDYFVDPSLEMFLRKVLLALSKTMKEPYKTQVILIWLRFEKELMEVHSQRCDSEDQIKVDQKCKAKLIKSEMKGILDQDCENTDVYCQYADCLYTLEGYKASWKILEMLLVTRSEGLIIENYKILLKVYISAIVVELKELKRLDKNTQTNEKSSKEKSLRLQCTNACWLSTLAIQNHAYQKWSKLGKYEMEELIEGSLNKNSNWIHKKLGGDLNLIVQGEQSSNHHVETHPVSYFNEFTARTFIQAWLLYFKTGDTESSDKFTTFVIDRLQRMDPLNENESSNYVLETLHKIKLDLLLYDGSIKSIQRGKHAFCSSIKMFPCNQYILENVILLNKLNIQANISTSLWRAILSTLVRNNTPNQAYVISILVRFLINKFLHWDGTKYEVTLDFQNMKTEDKSIGYLNQAAKLLDYFIHNSREKQLSSPIIWRLLFWITRVKHEISPIKYPLSNVKTIFYRSCQDNPGAKVFFLDVMSYCESATKTDIIDMKGKYIRKKYRNALKSVMETQTELQHLMTEKEIHIRIPMEEVQVMLDPEDV